MTIAELRRSNGLTQTEVADLLGLKQSYYSRVERGKGNPSLRVVADLADVLHQPVGEVAEALAKLLRSRTIPGSLRSLFAPLVAA